MISCYLIPGSKLDDPDYQDLIVWTLFVSSSPVIDKKVKPGCFFCQGRDACLFKKMDQVLADMPVSIMHGAIVQTLPGRNAGI
jgi:hypothetical protein